MPTTGYVCSTLKRSLASRFSGCLNDWLWAFTNIAPAPLQTAHDAMRPTPSTRSPLSRTTTPSPTPAPPRQRGEVDLMRRHDQYARPLPLREPLARGGGAGGFVSALVEERIEDRLLVHKTGECEFGGLAGAAPARGLDGAHVDAAGAQALADTAA